MKSKYFNYLTPHYKQSHYGIIILTKDYDTSLVIRSWSTDNTSYTSHDNTRYTLNDNINETRIRAYRKFA